MQRIRLAYRYEAEDNNNAHRLLAYVNYHILAVNASKEMPAYINFLRERGLTNEVRMTEEETEAERVRMLEDINAVIDARLASGGQRALTPEEVKAIQDGRRRIQDSGRGGGHSRPSRTPDQHIPQPGGVSSQLDQAEFCRD